MAQSWLWRKKSADRGERLFGVGDLVFNGSVDLLVTGGLLLCINLAIGLICIAAIGLFALWRNMLEEERNFVERLSDYECPSLPKAAERLERLLESGRRPAPLNPSQSASLREALEMYAQIVPRRSEALQYARPVAKLLATFGGEEDLPVLRRLANRVPAHQSEIAAEFDSAIASIEKRSRENREAKMLLRPAEAESEPQSQLLRPSFSVADPAPQELLRASRKDE